MKTAMTTFVGGLFGFVMSRIGFTSWDLVHGMFTFTNLHLLFTFMMAVTLLTVAWYVIGAASKKQPTMSPRGMHPGIVIGGALFGVGWALSGGCPTIVLAQIGEGQLAAFITLGGIVVGNWIYSILHERFFKWPLGSCLDD
jgi:uncharacterized membrane protein YedE/YeeE